MESRKKFKILPKTAWKRLSTNDLGLGSDPDFMLEFTDFQELTDYELVSKPERKRKAEGDFSVPKKTKKQKVKKGAETQQKNGVTKKLSATKQKKADKQRKVWEQKQEKTLDTVEVPPQEMPAGFLLTKDDSDKIVAFTTQEKTTKVAKVRPSYTTNPAPKLDSDQSVGTVSPIDMLAWRNCFVPEPLVQALVDQRFAEPTRIQLEILPSAIRDRRDVVGAAETGSGKTLAFGLPIITHILEDREAEARQELVSDAKTMRNTKLRALIVTPTRELAIQVKNHLVAVCAYTTVKVCVVVGGMSVDKQTRLLKRCPDIVIGTPGRLWELIEEGNPHLSQVTEIKYFVIDEADRMMEKGHFEDLLKLLHLLNGESGEHMDTRKRQTFLFSATLTMVHNLPVRVLKKQKKRSFKELSQESKLERLYQLVGVRDKPKVVDITRKLGTAETLTEAKITCTNKDKDVYLYYLLSVYQGRTLVFCNSIDCVRRLTNILGFLQRTPYPLHASMHQKQRLKNLERFTASKNGLLLATDVAARGLDIPNVDHVIHYQIPRTTEAYVHRSGRTARALKEGLSIMIVDANDTQSYRRICKSLNREGDLPSFPVDTSTLNDVKERMQLALELDKLEHRSRKTQSESNWFTKAAAEMDIELDDREYLFDIGDEQKQASLKRQMNTLQKNLKDLLRTPISRRFNIMNPRVIDVNLGKMLIREDNVAAPNALAKMKQEKKEHDQLLIEHHKKIKKNSVMKRNNRPKKRRA